MKPILLYLVLVGLPLLGIVGLLQVGHSLSAPVSLAGKWDAQLAPAQPQDSAPEAGLFHAGSTTVSITQSGPSLRLTFDSAPNTIFEGSIRDLTINASALDRGVGATTNSSNFTGTPVAFRARVDRLARPDRLVGVLSVDEGASRTELLLTATRQTDARKASGGQ